jgi:hypothetical protein
MAFLTARGAPGTPGLAVAVANEKGTATPAVPQSRMPGEDRPTHVALVPFPEC